MNKENRVEFRIRVGDYEIEVKGSLEDVKDLLERSMGYISKMIAKLPERSYTKEIKGEESIKETLPPIEVSEKESVTSILSKIFSTKWASKPRTLREIIEALESMGLHYPKSTVAVSLMRLAKRNVIRRIKKENIYVYVPVKPP
ncbi:hypothetical protein DRN86_04080 [Candidatus Geothermarchaeota archaeon]|nr:MAG: hypothetical protein DRN86_04080 [Candidatus Geothermarchaeota archaeon]